MGHFELTYFSRKFETSYTHIAVIEAFMDLTAYGVKISAWLRGLLTRGFDGASKAAAGLT
jgi:hypothetical protein